MKATTSPNVDLAEAPVLWEGAEFCEQANVAHTCIVFTSAAQDALMALYLFKLPEIRANA